MWIPHVLSKLKTHPDDGDLDEYHVLTQQRPGDHKLAEMINRRSGLPEQRSIAFIHDAGDRFYIGIDGRVLDVLGPDHNAAYEVRQTRQGPVRCRPIIFIHGYFAPKDGSVSIPDVQELIERQHQDLDEILTRANKEGAVQGKPMTVSPVIFSSKRAAGTDWDRYAREFEAGKHRGRTATFTKDGKLFRWLAAQQIQPAPKSAPEKKSPVQISTTGGRNNLLRMAAAAAVGAAVGGALGAVIGSAKGAVRGAAVGATVGVTFSIFLTGSQPDHPRPKLGADQ